MKIIKKIVVFFAISATLFACKKNTTAINRINITAPINNATYEYGDTVYLKGTITTDEEMHGYTLLIRTFDDKTPVFDAEKHVHGTTLSIDTFWVNNVAVHTNMELVTTVVVNHIGDMDSTITQFHCHPL